MLYSLLADIFVKGAPTSDGTLEAMISNMKMSIVSKSIDIVEEHYKTQLRRVTDGKSKYTRAYSTDTRTDEQKDTVSA